MNATFEKDNNRENPLLGKAKDLLSKIKSFKIPESFYYFIILISIGIGFYFIMLAENNFTLAYGGDYSAQYIPMGYHIWDYYHEWFRTGHFTLFDSTLYLGVNSFGSNAYYGLFSPFNIIIIIFPRSLVPQALAISSIVKLACAGMFFTWYMTKAFKIKINIARVCGIAYAFAGWGAFYLWYNNYQDILVFFPLVLLGIERTIQEEKPWILCVGVFFLSICNYVLMVPYIICAFFYAMFRYFQLVKGRSFLTNLRILGYGFIGFAGGLLMGLFVVMPAFMATMSSPKLEVESYGQQLKTYLFSGKFKEFIKLLISWKSAADQHDRILPIRVFYPILEFFFPATTCRSLPTLELYGWDFDDMAVSLWCYVPFILFLVPALIQSGKEKKWSHYIGFVLLVVSLFTPAIYFLTMGFSNGYARWTLFIASSLIAYVGIYIDKIPNVSRWHIHFGYAFALIGIIAAWILTNKLYRPDTKTWYEPIHRFVEDGYDFTNLAFIIEITYVTGIYLALFFTYYKKAFRLIISLCVSAEAIAMGNFVTMGHGYDRGYNNGYLNNEHFRTVLKQVQNNDDSYYRIYTSIGDGRSINNSFINNYNAVSFFHSLYNFEVNDFTLWTGIRNGTKSVSGDYRGKYQDLDNLLGVKYYFISKDKSKYDAIEQNNPGGYLANVPFDFEENKEYEKYSDEYLVYENKTLNGFGYSYDTLYNGTLPSEEDRIRFDVNTIKNIVKLSTNAIVNAEDSQEIQAQYSDINIIDKMPDELDDSLDELSLDTDYKHFFYNVGTTAKYYPFEKIPSIPNNKEFGPTTFTYDNDSEKGPFVTDYFVFYTAKNSNKPLFKENTTLYICAAFSSSEKYNFYFLDKNNKIFMFDCHDDDTSDNTSYMRGFYIRKDVYKMAVCGKYSKSYLKDNNIRMYTEDRSVYEARRDALNADPIDNVKYQKDKFTFETHYTNNKFVVSRVAYDIGWKLKATDMDTGKTTNTKIYKGNGGFVSFVAPQGNYSYELVYETPYLALSYLVSALSFTAFMASLMGYHLYQEKKRRYHLDKLFREN